MNPLIEIIISEDPAVRDQSLFAYCEKCDRDELLQHCEALEAFWKSTDNLYHRVRALFFLYAIHRFVLPMHTAEAHYGPIPYVAYQHLLSRRFNEAISAFMRNETDPRLNDTVGSGLSHSYMQLGLQYLADQVRACVRGVVGNQWMFRTGHPLDFPLRLRKELLSNRGQLPYSQ